MKTALAIALVALSGSVARAGEPVAAPEAPAVGVEAAPLVPIAKAEAGVEAAPAAQVAPGNFCGQHLVAGLLLKTEIGQQLQHEQNAAVERALAQQNIEAAKAVAPPAPASPPAEEAKAQAAEALPGAGMPRGIDGKRLQSAWLLNTEAGTQLHRSYMAALMETQGNVPLYEAFAQPRRKWTDGLFKTSNRRELEAQGWTFFVPEAAPEQKQR